MTRKRFTLVLTFATAALGSFVLSTPTSAQTTDSALKDRVGQLVEKLGSTKVEAAKSAEDALIKLGPRVLPLLPDDVKGTPESKPRLERIRAALKESMDQVNLGATMITLKAKGMRLSEVVQKLQAMSGNPITDVRDMDGAGTGNPALDLDIDNKPFLEAVDIISKQGGFVPSFYSGDGSIAMTPGAMAAEGTPEPNKPLLSYTGPFRVAFKQIAIARDLQTDVATASAQFEIAWEPRLRPMLLKLKADEIKIVDDLGKEVEAQVSAESTDVVLRPENPVADMNLTLKAPQRAAKLLKSVKVKADLTIPAGLKTFKFPSLGAKDPVTIKQKDIEVTLEGTEIEEQVWKVNVVLSYPGEGEAFESYRQGLFNNRLWLQKADGSRFEHNGGFSNTSAEGGKLGFEYLFVDAPGKPSDYQLVYETPSEVKTIPLEFEFKDVPLP